MQHLWPELAKVGPLRLTALLRILLSGAVDHPRGPEATTLRPLKAILWGFRPFIPGLDRPRVASG